MKKRVRLLIGLGIVFSLTMAIPVFASEVSEPIPYETQSPDGESGTQSDDNISVSWVQEKTDAEHMDQWYLSLTDSSAEPAHVSRFEGNGAYKINEKIYFLKDGYLQTGVCRIENAPDSESVEDDIIPYDELTVGKTYYFTEIGTTPSDDAAGSLLTGKNQWITVTGETEIKMHYILESGEVDTSCTGYVEIDENHYFLAEDGTVQTGVQIAGGIKYYFDKSSGGKQVMLTGWQLLDGQLYYFNSRSEISNSGQNGWLKQFGHWYWFQNGEMQTGWRKIKDIWYYLDPGNGIMKTGWYSDGKATYYSDAGGAMKTGWIKLNNTWYYLNSSGALQTGFYTVKGVRYYADSNGAMKTGWLKINGTWYYFSTSGAMQCGWLKSKNLWYYLDPSTGSMKTEWVRVNGIWYYLDPSNGDMKTGWIKVKDIWYYLYPNGSMAANRWVGDYYLLGNGAMATNQWINGCWVGEDGKWVKGYSPDATGGHWVKEGNKWYFKTVSNAYLCNCWKKIDGVWYYFKKDCSMTTGWQYIGAYKYYFASSGKLMQDLDGILPKQSSYKITVNRKKCQVMVYAIDPASGRYIIPVKTFICSVGVENSPTPTGTFSTLARYRGHTLMGPSYGQYCTRIVDQVLFHSVATVKNTNNCLSAAEYNMLGSPASHGCVRLTVGDAKWIYDNCSLGTTVVISDSEATPFDKPVLKKMAPNETWDPTDPNPPSDKEYPLS